MQCHSLAEFVPILQTAIGPALLISGVGLLMLGMINRLHHLTDRAMKLLDRADHPEPVRSAQLVVLWERARLVRLAIVLAAMSVLADALLVGSLFISNLLGFQEGWWLIGILFVIAMVALMLSILCFIGDVNRSLQVLRVGVERMPAGPAHANETK